MKFKIYLITFVLCLGSFINNYAQTKSKLRLSVSYLKEMNHAKYLIVSAKYKINKKYRPAVKTHFFIYQNFERDSSLLIGKLILNKNGRAKLKLQKNIDNKNLNFTVKLLDTTQFYPTKKSINIKDINLEVSTITEGKNNYVLGVLYDALNKNPIKGIPLKVQVKRTFNSLSIGDKNFYMTDSNGRVKVLIPNNIPAINGILTVNLGIEKNKKYGTIKAFTITPMGVSISEDTSYDQRKLWGARGKEPLFLFSIFITLGVIIWSAIIHVVISIYKISKL